ncbi:hypothetical protein BDV95DRAFT_653034, partial [Massariosphaeria phaeospora]
GSPVARGRCPDHRRAWPPQRDLHHDPPHATRLSACASDIAMRCSSGLPPPERQRDFESATAGERGGLPFAERALLGANRCFHGWCASAKRTWGWGERQSRPESICETAYAALPIAPTSDRLAAGAAKAPRQPAGGYALTLHLHQAVFQGPPTRLPSRATSYPTWTKLGKRSRLSDASHTPPPSPYTNYYVYPSLALLPLMSSLCATGLLLPSHANTRRRQCKLYACFRSKPTHPGARAFIVSIVFLSPHTQSPRSIHASSASWPIIVLDTTNHSPSPRHVRQPPRSLQCTTGDLGLETLIDFTRPQLERRIANH